MSAKTDHELSGGCLCGGVRYRLTGPARDILNCHCTNCRRTHGHVAAYTAVKRSELELSQAETLSWYHDESPGTDRGFCNRCGASLFWDPRDDSNRISISAGTLDHSRGLSTVGHVFVGEAGSYYRVDDGLPQFEFSSEAEFELK